MPSLYVISGCNGAGKTTASFTILPEMLKCNEFVNADEIARGISPFQPSKVAVEAGRIMLIRIKGLLKQGVDFAFETTLATRSYVHFIHDAQARGYFVMLVYFWLNSPDLAVARVNDRVLSGGHSIPEDVIRRRYAAGMSNLSRLYLPISDYWLIIDNSELPFQIVAEGSRKICFDISNRRTYEQIIKHDQE
jgi:predicted ABC-type ATPase